MTIARKVVAGTLLALLTTATGSAQTPWALETAQAQVSRSKLIGTWYADAEDKRYNVDNYAFRSNGTYLFKAGREKSRSGNVAHSGTWRILNGGRTLLLRTTRRTVISAGKRITLPAARTFRLSLDSMGSAVTIDGFGFSR